MQAHASTPIADVLTVADLPSAALESITDAYELHLELVGPAAAIPGSFWGAPEAGIIGRSVFVRDDTPIHSFLHELSHIVCMTADRRSGLDRDAGGDDAEECAVCYLQILLAGEMPDVGRPRLMQDMDAWGYSFRLGSTARWFSEDAAEAREWLHVRNLIGAAEDITWRLRDKL